MAFTKRMTALLGRVSEVDIDRNRARIRSLILGLARDGETLRPFEVFRDMLEEQLAGLVFTAHPTFGFSEDGWQTAGAVLARQDVDIGAGAMMPPGHSPSLEDERVMAGEAIRHTRDAIREASRITLEIAAELYPDDWRSLTPGFITVATWVGFDLDGRTDIGWQESLKFRYLLALDGLAALEGCLDSIEVEGDALPHIEAVGVGLKSFSANFSLGLGARE